MEKSKLTIIEAVVAMFKADDKSRITKFFARERKFYEHAIKTLEHNMATDKLRHELDTAKYDDAVEDMTLALADARIDVNPEFITSNSEIKDFGVTYRKKISNAKDNLKSAKLNRTTFKTEYKDSVDKNTLSLNDLKEELATRLDTFTV